MYIGETGRPFLVRMEEHKKSVKHANLKSATSEHIMNNPNHTIQWESVQWIQSNIENFKVRKLHEAIEIRRHKPQINRDQGLFLPNTYDPLI